MSRGFEVGSAVALRVAADREDKFEAGTFGVVVSPIMPLGEGEYGVEVALVRGVYTHNAPCWSMPHLFYLAELLTARGRDGWFISWRCTCLGLYPSAADVPAVCPEHFALQTDSPFLIPNALAPFGRRAGVE